MAVVQDLSTEMISYILSFVRKERLHGMGRSEGSPTLLNAALVCKAWTTPAQELIWRVVELVDFVDLYHDRPTRTMRFIASPGAGIGDGLRTKELILAMPTSTEQFLEVLECCPGLEMLTLERFHVTLDFSIFESAILAGAPSFLFFSPGKRRKANLIWVAQQS